MLGARASCSCSCSCSKWYSTFSVTDSCLCWLPLPTILRDNAWVSSENFSADPRLTVVLLGVATVVAQALLLREAMAAMGGSEIAWGVVMALWLAGMALGARIGVTVGSPRLAGILPSAVIVYYIIYN